MLEKKEFVDQIMVNEQNHVHVRTRTEIIENGEVISRTYMRCVLLQGDDISSQDAKVQAVCSTVWA